MRAPIQIHLPTLVWALAVAVGLLTPGPRLAPLGVSVGWIAVAAHVVLFLVLALLLRRSLAREGVGRPAVLAFLSAFAYGAALELAQIPVEGRGIDLLDFVANGAGALLGVLAARLRR